MAAPTKRVGEETARLDIKKGDRVRLLLPYWDGFQRFEADEVIVWTNDTPPTTDQACLASEAATPLTAPAMTDGKPPADYIDPRTGGKLPPVASH